MKTREELNALKAEVEILNRKLAGLTEDELKEVSGGAEYRDCESEEMHSEASEWQSGYSDSHVPR